MFSEILLINKSFSGDDSADTEFQCKMAPASSERKQGKNQYGAVRGLSGRYDFQK